MTGIPVGVRSAVPPAGCQRHQAQAQQQGRRGFGNGLVDVGGGGQRAVIGAVHLIGTRVDDRYQLVVGALSSDPE